MKRAKRKRTGQAFVGRRKEERSAPQSRGHGIINRKQKSTQERVGSERLGYGMGHKHGEYLRQWEQPSSLSEGSTGEATLKGATHTTRGD